MQSKSEGANRVEDNVYHVPQSSMFAGSWWNMNNVAYNPVSPAMMPGNASDSSSYEQSMDGQSQSDGGMNEEDDDAAKHSGDAAPPRPGGNYVQKDQNSQPVASSVPSRSDENLTQPPQFELVGHSIACAPYADPYYGGMMTAYGQPLVHPHLLDMHQARMPLPLEVAQEPVYVNAKQYHGILRRRQSRAKAELEKKLIKVRKPYLHESRHQHALRRARGTGGRFAKKTDADKETNSGSANSSQSVNSTGLEISTSSASDHIRSHQDPKAVDYVNGGSSVGNEGTFLESTYQSRTVT